MGLTFSCFKNVSVEHCDVKTFCFCFDKKTKKEELVYRDQLNQILIVTSPENAVRELVRYEELDVTDLHTFTLDLDENKEFTARIASSSGMYLFRGSEEYKTPEDIRGKLIDEVLPVSLVNFLKPIYLQTLEGRNLSINVTMSNGKELVTRFVRTFPIPDHRKRTIAGIAISSPVPVDLPTNVNKFVLNGRDSLKKAIPHKMTHRRNGKPAGNSTDTTTSDDSNDFNSLYQGHHSGILQNGLNMKPAEVFVVPERP